MLDKDDNGHLRASRKPRPYSFFRREKKRSKDQIQIVHYFVPYCVVTSLYVLLKPILYRV